MYRVKTIDLTCPLCWKEITILCIALEMLVYSQLEIK